MFGYRCFLAYAACRALRTCGDCPSAAVACRRTNEPRGGRNNRIPSRPCGKRKLQIAYWRVSKPHNRYRSNGQKYARKRTDRADACSAGDRPVRRLLRRAGRRNAARIDIKPVRLRRIRRRLRRLLVDRHRFLGRYPVCRIPPYTEMDAFDRRQPLIRSNANNLHPASIGSADGGCFLLESGLFFFLKSMRQPYSIIFYCLPSI